jgi:hypothetical protein
LSIVDPRSGLAIIHRFLHALSAHLADPGLTTYLISRRHLLAPLAFDFLEQGLLEERPFLLAGEGADQGRGAGS